jgi:hypothetical protein
MDFIAVSFIPFRKFEVIYLRYSVFSRNIWTEKTVTQYIEELSTNAQNLVAQDTVHYVQETGRPNNPGT